MESNPDRVELGERIAVLREPGETPEQTMLRILRHYERMKLALRHTAIEIMRLPPL